MSELAYIDRYIDTIDRTDDLISREDAIEALEKAKERYFDRAVVIARMQDILRAIPSAQQKQGEWYLDEERGATGIYMICSACEECIYITGDFKFCPNCGARMNSSEKPNNCEPQKDCLTCRYNSDEWDSPKCDGCSKAHSNYEPQTDCAWK